MDGYSFGRMDGWIDGWIGKEIKRDMCIYVVLP